jgi:6,7-dimethyl-8-ribityllumazine synthase
VILLLEKGTFMNQIATPLHTSSRIAIVQSCWHKDIADRGRESLVEIRLDEDEYERNPVGLRTGGA